MSIEIQNLSKTFFPGTSREHKALKNVSLTIKEGDFITIVGGNGAGKSTFLNAIAGNFALDEGTKERFRLVVIKLRILRTLNAQLTLVVSSKTQCKEQLLG